MVEEIWKPIQSADGYAISNFGNVKHLAHDTTVKVKRKKVVRHYDEKLLRTRMKEIYSYGHPTGRFFKEVRVNDGCALSVAEEVLKAFTDKPVAYYSKIIFKDGNPHNCTLDNLDYEEHNVDTIGTDSSNTTFYTKCLAYL